MSGPAGEKALYIVQPETVIRRHRQGFRYYWKWKSRRRRPGRSRISREIRDLVRELSRANPTWGAPRIHGELLELGIDLHQDTVSNYMVQPGRPPSQTWRTFLANHARDIASIDFFTVPTATFRVIDVFLVLDNARRRIIHINVTESPTAAWTGQQIVEAFPWDSAPTYLLRDQDSKYGEDFARRVTALDIEQELTSPHSPWQDPYVERVIGSIRRECLDHVIIVNERHLRRVVNEYLDDYHRDRMHLGLEKDCPEPRDVEPPDRGAIRRRPILGGLHHRYYRDAA
jgi:putative transposase